MSASSSNSLIPEGYTFTIGEALLSEGADKISRDMMDQAEKRDPDAQGLYIYNDFYDYAILDLVDHALSSIHTKVVKKNWAEAWQHLEALTVFMSIESNWPMLDDGDRVEMTDIAYGALLVTTIRALQSEGIFDKEHIPNLEAILIEATEWGSAIKSLTGKADYVRVLKGIGREMFDGRTDEQREQEKVEAKAMFQEWLAKQDEETRREHDTMMGKDDDDDEDEEDEEDEEEGEGKEEEEELKKKAENWYGPKGEGDAEYDDPDFKVTRTWKEYKAYLSNVPTKPLRGPSTWDLSKWPQVIKEEFSLDRYGSEGSAASDDGMEFF